MTDRHGDSESFGKLKMEQLIADLKQLAEDEPDFCFNCGMAGVTQALMDATIAEVAKRAGVVVEVLDGDDLAEMLQKVLSDIPNPDSTDLRSAKPKGHA